MQNDTYGEISPAELADLRANAQKCSTCGMLATVDPAFHTTRYGHAATFTDDRGTWTWNSAEHGWTIQQPTSHTHATGNQYPGRKCSQACAEDGARLEAERSQRSALTDTGPGSVS